MYKNNLHFVISPSSRIYSYENKYIMYLIVLYFPAKLVSE